MTSFIANERPQNRTFIFFFITLGHFLHSLQDELYKTLDAMVTANRSYILTPFSAKHILHCSPETSSLCTFRTYFHSSHSFTPCQPYYPDIKSYCIPIPLPHTFTY